MSQNVNRWSPQTIISFLTVIILSVILIGFSRCQNYTARTGYQSSANTLMTALDLSNEELQEVVKDYVVRQSFGDLDGRIGMGTNPILGLNIERKSDDTFLVRADVKVGNDPRQMRQLLCRRFIKPDGTLYWKAESYEPNPNLTTSKSETH